MASQPVVVGVGPGLPAGVDDALAQQELGQSASSPHQITTSVFTGTNQVPGVLLVRSRDRHRDVLIEPKQPRQMHRILGVNLDPVAAGALELRWCDHLTPDSGRGQGPGQSEACRPGLIGHSHWAGQVTEPGPDVLV